MAKVEQLIAKALSTSSEDEAIACLLMARKRSGVNTSDQPTQESKFSDVREKVEDSIKAVQQENQALRFYYTAIRERYRKLEIQKLEITRQYYTAVSFCVILTIVTTAIVVTAII